MTPTLVALILVSNGACTLLGAWIAHTARAGRSPLVTLPKPKPAAEPNTDEPQKRQVRL